MATKTLDPSRYTVTVQGVQVQGVADDTFFKLTMEGQQVMDEIGGQGDVVRIISRDQRATLEITLLPTSATNDFFSSLINQDLNANGPSSTGGYAVGASSLADLNGTTVIDAEETWLLQFADTELGSKRYNRVWKLRFAKARVNVGGNVL